MQDPLFFVIEMQESHPANPALLLFTEIQDGLWEGHLYKIHFLSLSLLSLSSVLSPFCKAQKRTFLKQPALR